MASESSPEADHSPERSLAARLLDRLAAQGVKAPRYELQGEIARGAMGAILRIWDADLRRHLAMKVVLGADGAPASGAAARIDPRVVTRFLEEAQVTGQLDHPGIVPVHELGLDGDGRLYFTMKLVEGRDLEAIFDLVFADEEGWNETRALGVLLKACEALSYAHRKGVIHRDLKPANVMVGGFGEVYVMDWGLARVLGREDARDLRIAPEVAGVGSSSASVRTDRSDVRRASPDDSPLHTMDGDIVGTPFYMPPEQARGEIEKLSARSDVYALGAMLYHLLARRKPYEQPGEASKAIDVLRAVRERRPTPLHELRRDVPPELEAICDKAMARDPARRYADTLDLAEDLRAFLERRVVKAYQTGAIVELQKWVQRNRALAASIAAAMLILIAGIFVSTAKTREAEAARRETAAKNEDLAAATQAAQDNEARAVAQEQLATQRSNDVLSLSAIQDLKELEARADRLWPADPEKLPEYEAWLADARVLIDGQPADPARGRKKRPSLAEHEAKLVEIRGKARAMTPEEIQARRKSSPTYAEWEQSRAKWIWMRRMLGLEPWPSEAEVEASMAKDTLPTDAASLNELAVPLVDMDAARIAYGGEVRGLALAWRAIDAAQETERDAIRETLSWALFRRGLTDEALDEAQRAVDEAQASHEERLARSLEQMRKQVALWTGEEARSKRAMEASELGARVEELERELDEHGVFEFEDAEDRWWHAQLTKLVSELTAFRDERTGGLYSAGISEEHGWGMVKRAEFARTIQERSIDGARAKGLWQEAIAAIAASPKYGGLELAPQLGLLPIGADPASGLWEFSHLATAEGFAPAERGADGAIVLEEGTGIVLVLIPGGTFHMGAQSTDPSGRNYDPQALGTESPVHEVTLSPYFLSKYEMTQAQWSRMTGRNPSQYTPANHERSWSRALDGITLLHPVERVTWSRCMELMSHSGLTLPSEAQWENGARGGTVTPFWTGSDLASLADAANIADAYGKLHGGESLRIWEQDFDDGNTVHARVGSYRANPFGLHDATGNVWEWCLDGYGESFYGDSSRVDPVAPDAGVFSRVFRGGGFFFTASFGRSSHRFSSTPEFQSHDLGLRPARAVQIP